MTGNLAKSLKGRCLCGDVTFELEPPFRDVLICNCIQCAQWTGHQVAATGVARDGLKITSGEKTLKWYRSSNAAQRGFCSTCGSSLFWDPDGQEHMSVMAGTVDDPEGVLKIAAHWYVEGQRAYVGTADDAPKFPKDTPPADPET